MEERHELVGLLVAEAVAPPILHELELGVDPLADGRAEAGCERTRQATVCSSGTEPPF